MALIIGQKFRVMQTLPYPFYRGREYVVEYIMGRNAKYVYTTGVLDGSDKVCELAFNIIYCEPVEDTPDRCRLCDAMTPGRTICCDCKDVSK